MREPCDWSAADDRAIMIGIANCDESALRALIDRYAPSVIAMCHRILSSRADAEDVAAELFAELWTRSDRFDGSRGNPRSYIYLLARSRCFDLLRKRPRQGKSAIGEGQLLELLIDDRSSPEESVELSDLATIAKSSLNELTIEQRTAIELAFFDGLTHQETAKTLGIPLGTTKSHIRKGLAKLRFLLKGSRSE